MAVLDHLLEIKKKLKDELSYKIIYNNDLPPVILFFVFSTGKERAEIVISRGKSFEHCWQEAETAFKSWRAKHRFSPVWLRVEAVNEIRTRSWLELKNLLTKSKRNYFRYGLSFDSSFNQAILEHEIYANALIYDNKYGYAVPNSNNLAAYGRRRFKKPLSWPSEDNQPVYLFKNRAFFTDGKALYPIEREGRNSGYRIIDNWGADYVGQVIDTSTDYLARQVKDSGEYHYGWFPCFDRPIPTYNALRHASSTYALIEGWEVIQEKAQKAAIERALHYLQQVLIKEVNLPDGTPAAFLVDVGDEIKLGGNAVCILAMAKYTEVTGDNKYLELMEKLALGILYMQNPDTGQLVHVLNYPDLSVKEEHRIIYYDGEAAFGLMRLYGITKDPRWINAVKKSFEYFIEKEHWRAHDHWLSYCVNELTLYDPDPKYYQFGLDNVRDHLDFVLNRLTTFPTLLELMMAAQRMITRLQETPDLAYLLEGFDIDKFYRALEHRARYLMNGFFYPEIAMFFKNPARVVGGFFIRHHTFRVRIDDVEHYLSGLVAYRKYLLG